jgi:hypothetical protein
MFWKGDLPSSIMSIRGEQVMGDGCPRLRLLPMFNIHAATLKIMISLEGATEPNITCKLTKAELLEFMGRLIEVNIYPCYTQSIEKAVKKVTAVCAADMRD